MDAAFERPFVAPGLGEHRARGRHMVFAARVGRAGERDLLVAQAQAVGRAAFDKRHGLQRLDRRARIDRALGVAEDHDDAAIRVDDRAGAAVGGFNPLSARGLDDHRVRHHSSPRGGRIANAIAKERRARQSKR